MKRCKSFLRLNFWVWGENLLPSHTKQQRFWERHFAKFFICFGLICVAWRFPRAEDEQLTTLTQWKLVASAGTSPIWCSFQLISTCLTWSDHLADSSIRTDLEPLGHMMIYSYYKQPQQILTHKQQHHSQSFRHLVNINHSPSTESFLLVPY